MRNEFRQTRGSYLPEDLRHAQGTNVPQHLLVFERREFAVDFGVSAGLVKRHVLIHDGHVNGVAERFPQPVDRAAGVFPLPREHQVTHDESLFQKSVITDNGGARHGKHRADRFRRGFKVVRDARILFPERGIKVLQIRHENVDESREAPKALGAFIPVAVPGDGERQPSEFGCRDGVDDRIGVVPRRDEFKARGAARLLFQENVREARRRHREPFAFC